MEKIGEIEAFFFSNSEIFEKDSFEIFGAKSREFVIFPVCAKILQRITEVINRYFV